MPSAREKLIDTAEALFYARGITATGVDTVVREAGVSKPTLYAHFRSKDELVAAVLAARHERRVGELGGAGDPMEVLEALGDFYAREGARGCAFLNAAAELGPAHPAVVAEKRWLERLLAERCGDERLASQLLLLLDGVAGRVVVHGPEAAAGAMADARSAAERLLAP
jgi:AcrR family transcriptional regulator